MRPKRQNICPNLRRLTKVHHFMTSHDPPALVSQRKKSKMGSSLQYLYDTFGPEIGVIDVLDRRTR